MEGQVNQAYDGDHKGQQTFEVEDPRVQKPKKWEVMKNVVCISIAFMVLFTSYQSMASLQSSINQADGLGTYSLSIIYAALIVSSQFTPSLVIKYAGAKWTMVGCMLCYTLYIGAQFYPTFYTLLPAAAILGTAAAPLWIAKCDYLTKVGNVYAKDVLEDTSLIESIVVRFFGLFFMFFQTSSVWGSLIASYALGIGRNTTEISPESLSKCGANYCPWSLEQKDEKEDNFETTKTQIYTLAGIYLACSLIGPLIIALLVDPLSKFGEVESKQTDAKDLLIATAKQLKKKKQLLLIPLTIWSGLEQGFFGADFTAGYVSCAYGVDQVGYVIVTFGVCDAFCSMALSLLIRLLGRIPIFCLGAIVNLLVIVAFFEWSPNPDEFYVVFVLAGLWGVSDAIWQTQINALYGVLFTGQEVTGGFSNYRLWESTGFLISYILQVNVCVDAKLWILISTLAIGMTGYLTVEYMEQESKQSAKREVVDIQT